MQLKLITFNAEAMTKIFFAFLLMTTFSMPGSAQNHIINNTLGKFEGTWQWTNGTDTVRLFLKKEAVATSSSTILDVIVGFHQYKQGNTIVEDSYSLKDRANSAIKFRTVFGYNYQGGDLLESTLRDLSRSKPLKLKLQLDANQTTLTWHSYLEGVRVNEIAGYTLPRDIVLQKL